MGKRDDEAVGIERDTSSLPDLGDLDFLDAMIAERTARNPEFPALLEAAMERREIARLHKQLEGGVGRAAGPTGEGDAQLHRGASSAGADFQSWLASTDPALPGGVSPRQPQD